MADIAAQLARLPLFAGIPEPDVAALAGASRVLSCAPGHALLREGEAGEDVILILDGEAAVDVGGVAVGTIRAGECVGEMSLLDNAPRSATVTSGSALQALVVPAARFRALLEGHPKVGNRLSRALTARLRRAQTGWAHLAGNPDVLLSSLLDLQASSDPATAERARRQAATLVARAAEHAHPSPDELDVLTPAERRVAELVAEGLPNPAIAERLSVSRHTVDSHVKHALAKLNVRSRVELAIVVLRSEPPAPPGG